jgi:hypothetical protein
LVSAYYQTFLTFVKSSPAITRVVSSCSGSEGEFLLFANAPDDLDLIKLFVVKRKTPASLRGLSEIYLVLHKNRRVKPFGALTAYWPEPL